ncbi:MAG: hypothetical protein P8Q90_04750, partial [Candidatus Thalassarchaeaceae archaeon]|nr:hypothetical protein [Candidatus Thalassarchaeaceae archaeon]
APTMEYAVKQATPRSAGDSKKRVWIHPDDLTYMYNWINNRTSDTASLAVLDDAHQAIQS